MRPGFCMGEFTVRVYSQRMLLAKFLSSAHSTETCIGRPRAKLRSIV